MPKTLIQHWCMHLLEVTTFDSRSNTQVFEKLGLENVVAPGRSLGLLRYSFRYLTVPTSSPFLAHPHPIAPSALLPPIVPSGAVLLPLLLLPLSSLLLVVIVAAPLSLVRLRSRAATAPAAAAAAASPVPASAAYESLDGVHSGRNMSIISGVALEVLKYICNGRFWRSISITLGGGVSEPGLQH